MKIVWTVEESDKRSLLQLYQKQKDNPFVKKRIERNIERQYDKIDKPYLWKKLVGCLLTTQQRSGPNSPISKFLRRGDFPLSYDNCVSSKDVGKLTIKSLEAETGIRRKNKLADELSCNLAWLDHNHGWDLLLSNVNRLEMRVDASTERETAGVLRQKIKGFGPKQSRNFLQALGLTQYEIPLDSRLMDWLNQNIKLPMVLNASGLSDNEYYNFVMDGIIKLCQESNMLPCLFDALVFSSYDKDWTEANANE